MTDVALESDRGMTVESRQSVAPSVLDEQLEQRVRDMCAGLSSRELGALGDVSAETARRYRNTGRASPQFLCRVASATGVSAEWLLFGRGPRQSSSMLEWQLKQCSMARLLRAVGEKLDDTDQGK